MSGSLFAAGMLGLLLLVSPGQAQGETYIVQPGDNLYRIAVQQGTDVNTLASINGIANTWQIYTGQTLILPSDDPVVESAAFDIPIDAPVASEVAVDGTVNFNAGTPLTHTISRGESLAQIAGLYALTPDQLAEMNDITNPNLIYAGQELVIGTALASPVETIMEPALPAPIVETVTVVEAPAPVETTVVDAEPIRHIVQRGEMLSQIADTYGVSWTAIAQANSIYNADTILAGQTLLIPGTASVSIASDGIASAEVVLIAETDPNLALLPVEAAPYAPIGVGREVLVDLSDSRVYAYENGVLVRNVLVSTGLPATPTVEGSFTVQRKYGAQTMSGPGYYLPDVPYVMYFYSGYALHGTYWHENWGYPMSHGCVNMPTPESEWFYYWTEVGTPVTVQA